MASIKLTNVCKVYDKSTAYAVEDFNLEIENKEFIVFVGPSGCGKSTTLRMIAGLEDITSGEIYIGDRYVNDTPPKDRDIAMVFQNYALYPHMTVFENMAFALKMQKKPKDEIKKQVERAAQILNITELLPRKPKALSGGERQRVAIGRAIVRHPQVFLMDEPLSNLDAKLRNQMRAELIKLRQRVDTTFVYVTHDQTEAMTLGDRIVVMKDGHIQQTGVPSEVFHRPANLFVAGFIGSPQMNFFEDCELILDGETYYLLLDGKKMKVNCSQQKMLLEQHVSSQRVTVGIRPEDIVISTSGEEAGLEGIVDVMELMGSEMIVHVKIGEQPVLVKVTEKNSVDLYGRGFLANHTTANLIFDTERMHLFSGQTGRNLCSG